MVRIALTVLMFLNATTHLAAEEPSQKTNAAATFAINGFACDLYHQLANTNHGENLFFSPYSISSALMMTVEGASNETAFEMGHVLNFPDSMKLADQQNRWNMPDIHAGIAALNARLRETDPQIVVAAEKRMAELLPKLTALRRQIASLQHEQKYREAAELASQDRAFVKQLEQQHARIKHYEVRMANALWGEKSFPFRNEFVTEISQRYETGGLIPVDFRNNHEAARQSINTWVEQQTRNRIQELLSPGTVDPTTRLVLTNAIYFKGDWEVPFKADNTKPEDFYLANGELKKVPLMTQRDHTAARYAAFNADGSFFDSPAQMERGQTEGLYPESGGFAALELPYEGGALSMELIAPVDKDGLPTVEALLSAENLENWTRKLKQRETHVYMPKVKLETKYQLGEGGRTPSGTLPAMGMVRAFKDPAFGEGAQFDRMMSSTDPNDRLYIGNVIHKAFLDINEKGTEAVAATAVIMMDPTSAVPADLIDFIPTFRADRPYLCLIRDRQSGTLLFMGRVSNPG
ncbi:MAG: serpin family protein [Planctomycetaceae bacterium]